MRELTMMVLLAGFLVMAGCNTMEGAGRDVETAGETMQEKADDNRASDAQTAPAEIPAR